MEKQFYITVTGGPLETNCYVVYLDAAQTVLIIDPGPSAQEIIKAVDKFPANAEKIVLLTHAHVDHISALSELLKIVKDIKTVYLHPDDNSLYLSPANQIPPFIPAIQNHPEVSHSLELDGKLYVPHHQNTENENNIIEIIHTPGHTRGSVCYFFPEYSVLFSGDTLFKGTIGRTDLPGGSYTDIVKSIKEKLFLLPQDTLVCPGHGNSTTIGAEMNENEIIT